MKLHKDIHKAREVKDEVRALKISVKNGIFPEELTDFPYLEELYLDGNCKKFPATPPRWTNLKILSIKWSDFEGDLSSLFTLPSLENLKIIETPIPTFLLPLGHAEAPLRSLTIKDCGLKLLPEEFSILLGLEEVNLSGNALTKLPYAFIDLQRLKRLNLDHNHFEIFPDAIQRLPRLGHLSIDGNNFSDEEKARIQREFHIWVN